MSVYMNQNPCVEHFSCEGVTGCGILSNYISEYKKRTLVGNRTRKLSFATQSLSTSRVYSEPCFIGKDNLYNSVSILINKNASYSINT